MKKAKLVIDIYTTENGIDAEMHAPELVEGKNEPYTKQFMALCNDIKDDYLKTGLKILSEDVMSGFVPVKQIFGEADDGV